MRTPSKHPAKSGGWIHPLDADAINTSADGAAAGATTNANGDPINFTAEDLRVFSQIGYAATKAGDLSPNPLIIDPVANFLAIASRANLGTIAALADAIRLPREAIVQAWGADVFRVSSIWFPSSNNTADVTDRHDRGFYGFGWAIPYRIRNETTGESEIVGFSARSISGVKRTVGHNGLALPLRWRERATGTPATESTPATLAVPILIVEGHSDTTSLDYCGCAAIGRPNNTGGALAIVAELNSVPSTTTIIIVGENDQKPDGAWPGRDGANHVGHFIASRFPDRTVLIAYPPPEFKDARDFVVARLAAGDSPAAIGTAFTNHLIDTAIPAKQTATASESNSAARRRDLKSLNRSTPEQLAFDRTFSVSLAIATVGLVEFNDDLSRHSKCGFCRGIKNKIDPTRRGAVRTLCHRRLNGPGGCDRCAAREAFLDAEHFGDILIALPVVYGWIGPMSQRRRIIREINSRRKRKSTDPKSMKLKSNYIPGTGDHVSVALPGAKCVIFSDCHFADARRIDPVDAAFDFAYAMSKVSSLVSRRKPVRASHYWVRRDRRTKDWMIDNEALPLQAMGVTYEQLRETLAAAHVKTKEITNFSQTADAALFFDLNDTRMANLVKWFSWAREFECKPHEMDGFSLDRGPNDGNGDSFGWGNGGENGGESVVDYNHWFKFTTNSHTREPASAPW